MDSRELSLTARQNKVEREYLRHIPVLPDHHKDPFDRLLVATAITENMTLITIDENIHKYDALFLW